MDSETKAILLELCRLCRETSKNASEARLLGVRIHDALVNAHVPGYFVAYEAAEVRFKELAQAKCELEKLVDTALGKVLERTET
jgi:hypothetical protein